MSLFCGRNSFVPPCEEYFCSSYSECPTNWYCSLRLFVIFHSFISFIFSLQSPELEYRHEVMGRLSKYDTEVKVEIIPNNHQPSSSPSSGYSNSTYDSYGNEYYFGKWASGKIFCEDRKYKSDCILNLFNRMERRRHKQTAQRVCMQQWYGGRFVYATPVMGGYHQLNSEHRSRECHYAGLNCDTGEIGNDRWSFHGTTCIAAAQPTGNQIGTEATFAQSQSASSVQSSSPSDAPPGASASTATATALDAFE